MKTPNLRKPFRSGWLQVLGMAWFLGSVGLLWAWAQGVVYPPGFGPLEALRRQAHAQCQARLAQGVEAYALCLTQMASALCLGPSASSLDPVSGVNCTAAASAGYPAPGKPVLSQPSYRVEVVGGFERHRDPRTGQVLRETPIAPYLLFTLERTPQGVYRGTSFDVQGRPQIAYFVSPACELLDASGQPAMDGWRCPVYPDKPFLLYLQDPPAPGFPPNALRFTPGRLADDFDRDGVVEVGYVATGGSGGRVFTSGWAQALGYDPSTRLLKYEYLMAVREGESPHTSYALERLLRFRVR